MSGVTVGGNRKIGVGLKSGKSNTGWCHEKQLPSLCTFCVHHTPLFWEDLVAVVCLFCFCFCVVAVVVVVFVVLFVVWGGGLLLGFFGVFFFFWGGGVLFFVRLFVFSCPPPPPPPTSFGLYIVLVFILQVAPKSWDNGVR